MPARESLSHPSRPLPDSLAAALVRLRCPHCGAALSAHGRTLGCERGHRYDVARQGYVSLFGPGGAPHSGDTAEMVAAREAFLRADHYAPLSRALADAVSEAAKGADRGWVLDVGAGTGRHLAAVLERLGGWHGIAVDASRDALRKAVRAHAAIAAVACDVWRPLPVRDAAVDVVLDVFAPRNGPEIARVLAPGGTLVVVTPGPRHLEELIAAIGMLEVGADKQRRLQAALASHLSPGSTRAVEFEMVLNHDALRALVTMGPTVHHLRPDEIERRVRRLPDPMTVTASVVVDTFRRL